MTEPGTLEIPAAMARARIADALGGRRSPFAGVPTKLRVLPVPPSQLVVKDLPPPPPNFSGLVGDFTFRSDVDRREAAVGVSINQFVEVRGNGTIERFTLPRPDNLDGVRIYDGTPATAARVDGDGYKAEGRYSRVLVPTKPGTLTMPPLEIVTFSPSRGEYVTHTLTIPPLTIRQGKVSDTTFESFVEDPALDTDAILVEEPFEGVRDVQPSGWASTAWLGGLMPWTLALAGAPLLLLGGVEGFRFGRDLARKLRTPKKPRTRDVTPRQRLARLPADPQRRLAELDAALRHALARATAQPIERLDRDAAMAQLPEALAEKVSETTRQLDRARFGEGAMKDVLARLEAAVKALVDELERA